MAKDPAALFYIDHWLVATREMRADCRGWYLNLVLHQFKSGSLPNEIEELANLAGVRISEFEMFQQVWQQVLKQKFEVLPTNRLQDFEAAEIIRAREDFKEKRAAAGRMSAFIKFIRRELCSDENIIFFIKTNTDPHQIVTTDQQVLKQVYQQMIQLYINRNKDKNRIDEVKGGMGGKGEGRTLGSDGWNQFPGERELQLELPPSEAQAAIQLFALAGTTAEIEQIDKLWKIFKTLNFKGKKFYHQDGDVFNHFVNWTKTQKVNGSEKRTPPNRGYAGRGATNGIDPTKIEREGVGKLR